MIIKLIENPDKSASASLRAKALSSYILSPQTQDRQEKCVYSGSRGFLTDEPRLQQKELAAWSVVSKSKDPLLHYVVSWQEGEKPTNEQIEELVDIFLDENGLTNHQVVFGLHQDTQNYHLHICVNRVDLYTGKCTDINRGLTHEAAQKALARIEAVQGWRREKNARYEYIGGEAVRTTKENRTSKVIQQVQDRENATGEMSAQTYAVQHLEEALKDASTWQELHARLAEHQIVYQKKGSGASVGVSGFGDKTIFFKASDINRNATLARLQKRFGTFVESDIREDAIPKKRIEEPVVQGFPLLDEYLSFRRTYLAERRQKKQELDQKYNALFNELVTSNRAERKSVLHLSERGYWKGRGKERNAAISLLAQKHQGLMADLKAEKKKAYEAFRNDMPSLIPSFEQWLRLREEEDLAEAWRRRNRILILIAEEATQEKTQTLLITLKDFTTELTRSHAVAYKRNQSNESSFVDYGRQIIVYDISEEAVLAALQLSQQKWGRICISGSDEYKEICCRLAAEHNIKIMNEELQDRIAEKRKEIEKDRVPDYIAEKFESIIFNDYFGDASYDEEDRVIQTIPEDLYNEMLKINAKIVDECLTQYRRHNGVPDEKIAETILERYRTHRDFSRVRAELRLELCVETNDPTPVLSDRDLMKEIVDIYTERLEQAYRDAFQDKTAYSYEKREVRARFRNENPILKQIYDLYFDTQNTIDMPRDPHTRKKTHIR